MFTDFHPLILIITSACSPSPLHLTTSLLLTEPARFIRKLENTTFRVGEPLTLRVAFVGSQRMNVSWRKDGRPIWASYQYNVKTTDCSCVLEVLNSDREEARGRYTCEISNAEGSDICHAYVKLGNTNRQHRAGGSHQSFNA